MRDFIKWFKSGDDLHYKLWLICATEVFCFIFVVIVDVVNALVG